MGNIKTLRKKYNHSVSILKKRLTITSNKENVSQREMEIFALQIRIHSSNTDNTQCCYWEGNSPSLTQWCWPCKLFSFLESSLTDISRTLKMLIPCDPGVQFLGIYSEEATMNVHKKFMGKRLCTALLIIMKIQKQPT